MPDRPRAFVTAPLRGAGFEKLQTLADVIYEPWIEQTPLRMMKADELAQRLESEGATVVIVEADEVKGPVLDLPLLAIGSTRGDPNNVDLDTATARGIPVLRAPGRNADAVAEMTVALLFAVNRHLIAADRDVRAGDVYQDGTIPYQRFRAWELNGRTAGLVGLGAVGRATKWRLEGLGMRVLSYDPYNADATHVDLDAMLGEVDVLSIHAVVSDETKAMIGPEQFDRMRDGAIFLNTARAQMHDGEALLKALTSGKLAGAGLDHFEGEWLDPASPLASMPTVVLTPHIGGATYDTEANHSQLIADGLEAILRGERPANLANPEVWK
ncbi:MAG: 3-phosphoglycerate dehydrogenase [Actinobacteria bacterium]|nr:3-phosphoglycerate dehydrogenase [Actinomycetota bacterium]